VRSWRLLAALLALACAGCAGLPQQDIGPEPLDRFERVNRGIYRFNRGFDRNLARPIARGYDRVVPPRVERHFRNFFTNLAAPTDIANNWLQGKFKPGFSDLGRFLLNTVAGAGFFDPAKKLGLERHPEDFGQTLATWGVPPGGYFMMPLFGPGSVRDWARGASTPGSTPLAHRRHEHAQWDAHLAPHLRPRRVAAARSARVEESLDEYALIRARFQRRRYELFDEAPPQNDDYLFLDSDPD
jgi:phospholipid-binding lipoprotein MlaA